MSKYTQFFAYEHVEGSHKLYRLTEELQWDIGAKGSGWVLIVEKYRVFDISVPRWLEWLQSPHDPCVLLAACIHDEILNRKHDVGFAAAEFRRGLLARNLNPLKAWIWFLAVLVWTACGRMINRRQRSFSEKPAFIEKST